MKPLSQILGKGGQWSQQLSTDEWKGFAKGVRSRRGNACECCRRTNLELNVHHAFYDPNLKPWEYGDDDVVLLCHQRHQEIHEQLKKFRRYVFKYLTPQSFRVLNGALAVGLTQYDPLRFCYALAEMAGSPGSVERFCEAWINTPPKRKSTRKNQPDPPHGGNIYTGPPETQKPAKVQFMPVEEK